MNAPLVVDTFAGPGGWDEGMRGFPLRVVGLEMDAPACATRAAAGHATVRADVAAYPPEAFRDARGFIASPPCPPWSMAGKGEGRAVVDRVHAAVELCRGGWTDEALGWDWADARIPLILQPLRWVWALRGSLDWIACEQVPPALGVWQHIADVLRGWGFAAEARVLCAADYGVPQTRRRAVLIASRGPLRWPEPTHAEDAEPSLFGDARQPWVTMAAALGWGESIHAVRSSFGEPHRGKAAGSPKPEFDPREAPCRTIPTKVGDWKLSPGLTATQPNRRLYNPAAEPAPSVAFGHDAANWRWVHERPATTLVGTFRPDIVAGPGYSHAGGPSRQDRPGSVRITVSEAAVLQSFPADYPFAGTKGQQFQQVGNAVPPMLARAVIGALAGVA